MHNKKFIMFNYVMKVALYNEKFIMFNYVMKN